MIHNNLKILRKAIGISQRELGRKIEMSGQYIAKIEKNERTPTIETLKKIAIALNVDLSELLERPKFTSEIFFDKINEKNISPNRMITDCKLDEHSLQVALFCDQSFSSNGAVYSVDNYYTVGSYLGFSKDFLEKRQYIDSEIRNTMTSYYYYEYMTKLDVSYNLWVNNYYENYNLNGISFSEIRPMIEKKSEELRSKYAESDNFCLSDIDNYFYSTLIDILSFASTSNALNYGSSDFSFEELNELSNFIFNSYQLKVNEILERHKNK